MRRNSLLFLAILLACLAATLPAAGETGDSAPQTADDPTPPRPSMAPT